MEIFTYFPRIKASFVTNNCYIFTWAQSPSSFSILLAREEVVLAVHIALEHAISLSIQLESARAKRSTMLDLKNTLTV